MGESRKPLRARKPAAPEGRGVAGQRREHVPGRVRVLQRDPAVALDEDHQHVAAPQPGEQVAGGHVGQRVGGQGGGELPLSAVRRAHQPDPVVGQGRGAGRGHRRPRQRLQPEDRGQHPRHAHRRHRAGGATAVPAGQGRHPQHRGRYADQHGRGQQHHPDEHRIRGRAADRVAEQPHRRAGVPPVVERVERSPERGAEAHVEQPEQGEQGQGQPRAPGQQPRGSGRQHQHQGDEQHPLERDAQQRRRTRPRPAVRRDQRRPDQRQRQDVADHDARPGGASPAGRSGAATSTRPRGRRTR